MSFERRFLSVRRRSARHLAALSNSFVFERNRNFRTVLTTGRQSVTMNLVPVVPGKSNLSFFGQEGSL